MVGTLAEIKQGIKRSLPCFTTANQGFPRKKQGLNLEILYIVEKTY